MDFFYTYQLRERIKMSIFTKILNKLGIGGKDAGEKPAAAPKTSTAPSEAKRFGAPRTGPMKSKEMPMVDVVSKLEGLAKANPAKLNWKTSIVDLLKLLDIDSSLEARKELAKELGCPAELMGGDSAKMNIWLHKTVLKKIAENGGNVPKELLD
jgi:hypothetical protein